MLCALLVVVLSACAPGATGPDATGSAAASSAVAPAPSLDVVRALLERRAIAVRSGDADGVGRTEVPGAVSPVRDRATALPLAVWRYDAIEVAAQTAGLHEVRARLTYRLERDPADVEVDVRLALRSGPAGWLVASERVEGRAELWELGDVRVVVQAAAVVVAIGPAGGSAQALASTGARAVDDVDAAWGRPWQRSLVIVLVPSVDLMARALDRPAADLDGVGAVTAAAAGAPGRGTPTTRVWLAEPVVAPLAERERLVLLRHEAVHVASGSVLAPGVPAWLIEGLAEHVGYGDEVPLAVSAAAFLTAVSRDGAPAQLPGASDLAGPDLEVGYGGAHLAVDVLVRDVGIEGVVEVYRLSRGDDGPPLDIDAALRRVTGQGIEALTAAWRARALALAG